MRSIVLKIFQKVSNNQTVKLFKSHHPHYKDGEQMRDFIYVKDVVNIIKWFVDNKNIITALTNLIKWEKVDHVSVIHSGELLTKFNQPIGSNHRG